MKYILILTLITSHAFAKDMCFYSHKEAAVFAKRWEDRAKAFMVQMAQQKKKIMPTKITADRCTHCILVEGDSIVEGMVEENFAEKEKLLRKPGTVEIKNLPVEVAIGGLMPWEKHYGGKVHYNAHYVPFMKFPDMTSNTFYMTDSENDKTPVDVNVKMFHPELVQFEFRMKGKTNIVSTGINEGVSCLFPDMKGEQKFFVKENGKFLELKGLGLKAFRKELP